MQWTTDDLLPNVVERLRKRKRPFVSVVAPDGRLENLSVEDIHNASNRAAWFLHRHLQTHEEKFFYMGPNDVRYVIWTLAAMKAGKCVVCPSPNNTVPSNMRLFSTVGATKLLYAPENAIPLQALLESTNGTIQSISTPSYSDMLDKTAVDDYPFPFTFDEVKEKAFMALHTSGTSGHPKPIYWNHTAVATVTVPFDFDTLPQPPQKQNLLFEILQGHNVFSPFPLYHFGGIGLVLRSFFTDTTIVLPAPGTPLSPNNFAKMIDTSASTAAVTPPSILEAMLNGAYEIEVLSKLKHIAYSGGPLNPVLGEKLADIVAHLFPLYGCTEGAGPYLESTGDNKHWNGMKFIDMGQRMEEVIPGLYELIITRTEPFLRSTAYFHTCPHLEEFRTSDLFAPIEGSDGWWTFRGRTDNWITLSNGLKMDPTNLENALGAHPDVMGVLAAGSHRFQLCLLIELKPNSIPQSDEQRRNMLEKLWPKIEVANNTAPKFGRVPKELVMFTSPDKPFSRASKGTIQRRLSVDAYADEIEDLYTKAEEGLLTSGLPVLKSTSADDLMPFLQEVCSETLGSEELAVDDDLFTKGLDSLLIVNLVARIKAGLRKHDVPEEVLGRIDNALLFTSTTISILAQRIAYVLLGLNGAVPITNTSEVNSLREMLGKYEAKLSFISEDHPQNGKAVVLTGSRGSLGCYILAALLSRDDVKMVYCLNRSSGVEADQVASFKARGLPALQLDRVRFLQTDLAKPNLGLTDDQYASLMTDTTAIIHNAYPVNFIMPVQSFAPQIEGLLNLLILARDSVRSPDVLFVSSIAAAMPVSGSRTVVKEAVLDIDDVDSILQQGYGQSKFICERIMEKYASSGRGKGAILRLGQVTGPLKGGGIWNAWEWAPSMMLSSSHLGVVPDSIGTETMEWTPVDVLGQIVSELMDDVARRMGGAAVVYNVLNPEATSWDELLPAVTAVIPETVSTAAWIERLEKSRSAGSHTLDQNPGLKLIDFYKQAFLSSADRHEVVVEKDNLLKGSQTARELSRVKADNFAKWMKGWGL
ncbi:hypothetical protein F4808DRAFT_34080 [Astrocystis sublimbata]|nr:hypothetical protein F4808DRAFT_34080 [Astrocystis sublimbata]